MEEEDGSSVLLLRRLPAVCTPELLEDALKVYGGPVRAVRLIRDHATGAPRIAFAEFASARDARAVLSAAEGRLCVAGGAVVSLELSHSAPRCGDWVCARCRTLNFARREECFSCRAQRNSSADEEDAAAAAATAETATVVVRGLRASSGDAELRRYFEAQIGLSVKEVRVVRDRDTGLGRGVAFVEFFGAEDARTAVRQCNQCRVEADGRPVQVAFARGGPSSRWRGEDSATAASSASVAVAQTTEPSMADAEQVQAWAAYYQSLEAWSYAASAAIAAATASTSAPKTHAAEDIDAQLREFYAQVGSAEQPQEQTRDSCVVVAAAAPAAPSAEKKKGKEDKKQSPKGTQKKSASSSALPPPPTVCILCKRQFPNEEALDRHVRLSQLHKHNLELKAQEEAQLKRQAAALGRRAATECSPQSKRVHAEDESARAASAEQAIPEDNVGSQMLRRMGWSDGMGLGKASGGIVAPIQVSGQHQHGAGTHAGLGSSSSAEISDEYAEALRRLTT